MKKFILIFIFNILFLNFVLAVPTPPSIPKDPSAPWQTKNDIIEFFDGLLKTFAIIFWILAVGASFYAGYLFLFSGGAEEKIGKAKKMVLYAIIAIALGLMAYALPSLICSFLSPSGKCQSTQSGQGGQNFINQNLIQEAGKRALPNPFQR